MPKIIVLNKEEKLAILRIMIDINNHYSYLLPKAYEVIQKTATFFKIPNGIELAYSMSISEAVEILATTIRLDSSKLDFFYRILIYILKTSTSKVLDEAKVINDEYDRKDELLDNENHSEIEAEKDKLWDEYQNNIELLTERFIEEWNYLLKLFGKDFELELKIRFSTLLNTFMGVDYIDDIEDEILDEYFYVLIESRNEVLTSTKPPQIPVTNEEQMANFDSYVKNILETLRVCGVPAIAMRGLCDPDELFTGEDLNGSVGVNIASGYANALGHGDIYIYKGHNGDVKGAELKNVSPNFLSIIRGNGMFYGARYQTIKNTYSNNYVIYF